MINRPGGSRSIQFEPDLRVFCAVVLLLALALTAFTGTGAGASGTVQFTDVSPDAAFGQMDTTDDPADPGGQIDAIALDPTNTQIVYAAGESSGVWKSVDGGKNWAHTSKGLQWGATVSGALAVDNADSQRLLYAAEDGPPPADQSGIPLAPGGLYASLDGAASWFHISLPGCPNPAINTVAFSNGTAFVASNCGLAVSIGADLSSSTWHFVQPAPGTNGQPIDAVAAYGQVVYACSGQHVFQSLDRGDIWMGAPTVPDLPGPCLGLAAVPDDPTNFLAIYGVGNDVNVGLGRSAPGTQTFSPLSATLPKPPQAPHVYCCGTFSVYTVAHSPASGRVGPGYSYSVFATNKNGFYEYQPILGPDNPARWNLLHDLHQDTHGLAFPPAFSGSQCQIYAATDGGVFTNQPAVNGCSDRHFVRAMHGLHAFGSFSIAGVPGPATCPGGVAPCPSLYVASNDNGTWGTVTGGQGPSGWYDMGCCGDSGKVFVDPALPTQVMTIRNGWFYVWTSSNPSAPIVGSNVSSQANIIPPQASGSVTQVLTLPGQRATPKGDYIAVESPTRSGGSGADLIVRNLTATQNGWFSVGATFPAGLAGDVQASGGHNDTYIYILAANDQPQYGTQQGSVWRGHVVRNPANPLAGRVISWTNISTGINGLKRASSFFVDPYDPNVVYALDLGDPTTTSDDAIKFTTNATSANPTWQTDTSLMKLATANGRYRMACGPGFSTSPTRGINLGSYSYRYQCIINQIVFVPGHPELRFAILDPAGVAVSHNCASSGCTWKALSWPADSLVDRPDDAFYDATINPATGTPSLYVAQHGHGVVRIDASFSTL